MESACEIVILSGKGGTGKTSITASFAHLAGAAVLTDCDVDAADLHLVVDHTVVEEHEFTGGSTAVIDHATCRGCGVCADLCQFDAIARPTLLDRQWIVDALACEGCGVCAHFCPHGAIEMREVVAGHWYRSETRLGPMLHAQLGVGAENSGKLVTVLRRQARQVAVERGIDLLLTDGPPGIGCPVIASLTAAEHAVFITEPSVSGLHDLRRVATLAAGFRVPGSVIINKADIHPAQAAETRRFAESSGLTVLGEIPYDPFFVRAQVAGVSVVEHGDGPASEAIRAIWLRLRSELAAKPRSIGLTALQQPTKEH